MMRRLFHRLGGLRGLVLRARLTAAYSITSLTAMALLAALLLPVIELPESQFMPVAKVLLALLAFDLVGQTVYNEWAMRTMLAFFRARESGSADPELVRAATAEYLALPRRIAIACLAFWMFTVVSLCAAMWFMFQTSPFKLLYVLATTSAAACIAFIFQYSLFRRVFAPAGALLVRYGEGLESLRAAFHVGIRTRLMATFLLLIFSALALSGLMAYGQYVKVSGEQASVLAAASLHNVAEDLPADRSEWPRFIAQRGRFENYHLAVWIPEGDKLIGSLPIPFERLRTHIGKASGSFQDSQSLSQVSFRAASGAVLVAVMPPQVFLSGSLVILWVTLSILAITFGFAALIFNFVTRDIVAPFSVLRRFTQELAQGTMGDPPVIITEDELGRLGSALRLMGAGLRVMLGDLKTALESVKLTRQAIHADLREIQARSSEQDRNVDRSFMSFNELNQALRDIADNVEVVEKAARESKDASLEMGRFLDDIRVELAELADTVRAGSRFILSMVENAEQSTFGVASLREGIDRLRAQIEQIRKAFEELSGAVQGVLEHSGRAASLSNAGISAIEDTTAGVDNVRRATDSLLSDLRQFREGVLRIGGVVAVISDVTEQTALLAFNAAILAAQSQDEHAKDFAVVGDEIKDLADRTEASTKDVGQRMRAIQEQADRSLDEMREALGLIQQGQLLTQLAGDSVRQISEHSTRNDRDARSIGEGIYYQNHNLEEILKAVADEHKRVVNVGSFTEENGRDAAALRGELDQLLDFIRETQARSTEQGEGSRRIMQIVDSIGHGITQMRRDLRKLSGASGEVVELMNDVRFTSRRNAAQTDELGGQMKKLDQLLRSIEGKLASISGL